MEIGHSHRRRGGAECAAVGSDDAGIDGELEFTFDALAAEICHFHDAVELSHIDTDDAVLLGEGERMLFVHEQLVQFDGGAFGCFSNGTGLEQLHDFGGVLLVNGFGGQRRHGESHAVGGVLLRIALRTCPVRIIFIAGGEGEDRQKCACIEC